jgi:hypothetical protein
LIALRINVTPIDGEGLHRRDEGRHRHAFLRISSTSRHRVITKARFVYTIWSSADEVIGYGTIVYYESTCRIPGQNGEKTFSGYPYGHIGSKDQTAYYQLRMVRDHATN